MPRALARVQRGSKRSGESREKTHIECEAPLVKKSERALSIAIFK